MALIPETPFHLRNTFCEFDWNGTLLKWDFIEKIQNWWIYCDRTLLKECVAGSTGDRCLHIQRHSTLLSHDLFCLISTVYTRFELDIMEHMTGHFRIK